MRPPIYCSGELPPARHTNIHRDLGDADRAVPDADPNNREMDATEGRLNARPVEPAVAGLHRNSSGHHRVLRLLQGRSHSPRAGAGIPDAGYLGLVLDAIHGCINGHQVQEVSPVLWERCEEESADRDQLLQHRRLGNRFEHVAAGQSYSLKHHLD